MTKKTTKKHGSPVSYRLPVALEAEFYERVEKSGRSVSGYLTESWHGRPAPKQTRRPSVETKILAKMLRELGCISDAVRACVPDEEALSERERISYALVHEELRLLRAAFLKEMGRAP